MLNKVAVIGSGAWGTALSVQCSRAGRDTCIFSRNEKTVNNINKNKMNLGFNVPDNIHATQDFSKLNDYNIVLVVTPSYAAYEILELLQNVKLPSHTRIVIASKGLDHENECLLSNTFGKHFNNISILAGPNLAREVIEGRITVSTLAAENYDFAQEIINSISSPEFIIKYSEDVVKSQIASSIKNIAAIATGILAGLNYGENSIAYMVHNALDEIQLLSTNLGGSNKYQHPSPAVEGDVVLCCYSNRSRNRAFGYGLAKADDRNAFMEGYQDLTEGKFASQTLSKIANKHNIQLPLVNMVYKILSAPNNLDQEVSNYFKVCSSI